MTRLEKCDSVVLALDSMLRGIPVGRKLLPESVLAQELTCTRHTLRRALQGYVTNGVIARKRGAGTWLIRHPDQRPDEEILELWWAAFNGKDPTEQTHWADLLDHGPDVQIVAQTTSRASWLRHEDMACGAMRAGPRPALAVLSTPELLEQVSARVLVDLTEPRKTLPDWKDIEPWAWPLVSVKNAVFGIPYYTAAFGLWLETAALEQAHLLRSNPDNWDELTECLLQLKQVTGRALAATPASNAIYLLGTLTALAGGGLQHDPNLRSARRTDQALGAALDWVGDLVHRHQLMDAQTTFAFAPWRRLRERTFGFFHGTIGLAPGWAPEKSLDDYTFWPLPPAKSGCGHRYPLETWSFVLNRHIRREQRLAAMRYINLIMGQSNLRRRCEFESRAFLTRRSQWRWPEAPSWLWNVRRGWKWIVDQKLANLSAPKGLRPEHVTDLFVGTLLGDRLYPDGWWVSAKARSGKAATRPGRRRKTAAR